jgi:2-methylcitrate dehydratase PrpD
VTGPTATSLVDWALALQPSETDLELASRSLLDTVAVTIAARDHDVAQLARGESDALRFGAVGHVLDFDDLHMGSTAHVSVVCVPAVLATGGGPREYLAAAGVMSRLGMALGWSHYDSGWHITCTSGAVGAAVGAGLSLQLTREQLLAAVALAVPASGGVQRAFGTDAKSLQVGFTVEAGVRAARLASRGATADPGALDKWLELMAGHFEPELMSGPAIKGGLAVKIYPACYALQRPIHCLSALTKDVGLQASDITRITIRTPAATVAPLIHHRPTTGLRGKFSLEYAAATAILDRYSGFAAFDDNAVRRPEAQNLLALVDVQLEPGGDWLLDGTAEIEVVTAGGQAFHASEKYPPGSPDRPPTAAELDSKLHDCLSGSGLAPSDITWDCAANLLRSQLTASNHSQELSHAHNPA